MPSIQSAKFHAEDGSALALTIDDGLVEVIPAGHALLHRGLSDWLRAGGKIAPYYTIIAAEYANKEGSAVSMATREAGRVLVTRSPGKADRWAALEKWVAAGGEIAAYVPPAPASQAADLAVQEPDYGTASDASAHEVLVR